MLWTSLSHTWVTLKRFSIEYAWNYTIESHVSSFFRPNFPIPNLRVHPRLDDAWEKRTHCRGRKWTNNTPYLGNGARQLRQEVNYDYYSHIGSRTDAYGLSIPLLPNYWWPWMTLSWTAKWLRFYVSSPKSEDLGPIASQWLKLDP